MTIEVGGEKRYSGGVASFYCHGRRGMEGINPPPPPPPLREGFVAGEADETGS